MERHLGARSQLLAVEISLVSAAEVLDVVAALAPQDLGMLAADGSARNGDVAGSAATERGPVLAHFQALTLVGPPLDQEPRHAYWSGPAGTATGDFFTLPLPAV